ncbi:hypothetical protein LJR039_003581 [Pseudorhodoferax sp. LjRoot39]|uniref:hypothetical protein n=1 Tax=Pseudorhodoferax sp. LjRoot39 TaxID=3342328 RepID=UPI003ED11703
MLPHPTAPAEALAPEAPFWLSALRHFGTALLAVGTIALAVGLLSMPVKAQTLAELGIGHQKSASLFVLRQAQRTLETGEAVVFAQD